MSVSEVSELVRRRAGATSATATPSTWPSEATSVRELRRVVTGRSTQACKDVETIDR